jgi:hypothetical protein
MIIETLSDIEKIAKTAKKNTKFNETVRPDVDKMLQIIKSLKREVRFQRKSSALVCNQQSGIRVCHNCAALIKKGEIFAYIFVDNEMQPTCGGCFSVIFIGEKW